MDANQQVDVATMLRAVAQQLEQNRQQLDQVDNAGTHGQRVADGFAAAAQAAENAGTDDAGKQLQAAARALQSQGKGKSATFYAQGLQQAATKFMGQKGISAASLGTFLQSFLGGVEKHNPAKPGQGTMLDALGPAVNAFLAGQQSGNTQQGITNALGAAINGAAGTASGGTPDPGAASVTNILGGIFASVAPQLIGGLLGRLTGGGQAQGQGGGQAGGIDLGGLLGGLMGGQGSSQSGQAGNTSGGGGDLGGLLGGLMGGQSGQAGDTAGGNSAGGGIDLGGLLGGLMGAGAGAGSSGATAQGNSQTDWLGGLLGGMANNALGSGGSQGGGIDLGGLLGGLTGNQQQ